MSWPGERQRHSMSARGVSTAQMLQIPEHQFDKYNTSAYHDVDSAKKLIVPSSNMTKSKSYHITHLRIERHEYQYLNSIQKQILSKHMEAHELALQLELWRGEISTVNGYTLGDVESAAEFLIKKSLVTREQLQGVSSIDMIVYARKKGWKSNPNILKERTSSGMDKRGDDE